LIRYAITDPKYYNLDYLKSLDNKADYVLLRDKSNKDYKALAKEFINATKEYSYKKILHQDYILAKELNAFGVHLTSLGFKDIKKAKELNLFTIISTHSIDEIKRAYILGADAVTFSPIFKTPNKGEPKGLMALKEAVSCCKIKVIALGGIVTKEHIKQISLVNAWGFASIRYFVKD